MSRTFTYKAKDRTGQPFAGTIAADNETAVAAFIRDKGFFITEIKERRQVNFLSVFLNSLRPVAGKDLAALCWQLSALLNAGISLIPTLNTLIVQAGHPRLKAALHNSRQKVQEGSALSSALAGHPSVFPPLMVSMVEAGETGGVLGEVLRRLAGHYEKEHKMNEKVKSALTYPYIVLGMAAMAVAFILSFVLPVFSQLFHQMKVELPMPTRMLLAAGGFVLDYWPILLTLPALAALGLVYAYQQPRYRRLLDALLLQLPVYGLLTKKVAIARFSRTFGTLLRGGVPIINALEAVKKTTGNMVVSDLLHHAQISLRQGRGLATSLGEDNIFTPLVVQMVAVGEETGELDNMLDKIADFYESEVDHMVSRLNSLLEPAMIGVLGVIIGAIVLAVALPLFDIVAGVDRI